MAVERVSKHLSCAEGGSHIFLLQASKRSERISVSQTGAMEVVAVFFTTAAGDPEGGPLENLSGTTLSTPFSVPLYKLKTVYQV